MHHRNKVDAPSGTALLLGQAAAEGRRIDLAKCSERGRDGLTGARGHGKIGFASLRGGTVAGDHDVIFAGPEEMITLSHPAETRMIFALAAVLAALWLLNPKPDHYPMPKVRGRPGGGRRQIFTYSNGTGSGSVREDRVRNGKS